MNQLITMYEVNRLSIYHIARTLGTAPSTVRRRLIRMGVKLRTHSEASRLSMPPSINPKDEIAEMYLVDELSTYKIAKKFGCASSTIRRKLVKLGVELRSPSKAAQLQTRMRKIFFKCKICHIKQPLAELVEDRRHFPIITCCKRCAGYYIHIGGEYG